MKSSNKGKDFCVFALPGLFCFLQSSWYRLSTVFT